MRYIYIHGFNSGPESRSGNALEELLGKPVLRVKNDYSEPYSICMEKLARQITAEDCGCEPICLMGTSLGGFYALQARIANVAKVCAWNPVIFPALQLAEFVGENVRFTDNQKWTFSREAQLSYAAAADPRWWDNWTWGGKFHLSEQSAPVRQLYFGNHDEVLDHSVGVVYWQDHAPVEIIDSGHSIMDFSAAKAFLQD